MNNLEIYAQMLADLTGRRIALVDVNRMPCSDFEIPMTDETIKEMTVDFFDSLGAITHIEPKEQDK